MTDHTNSKVYTLKFVVVVVVVVVVEMGRRGGGGYSGFQYRCGW